MQSRTSGAISSSVSGKSTTKGYSTRQSVASVTCETRARPSKAMLSLRVCRESGLQHPLAQAGSVIEVVGESVHRGVGGGAQVEDRLVAQAPLVDLAQAVAQGFDQRFTALAVGQQIVFQIGVALHDPDVAEHLVEHPRRAAGDALAAQFVEDRPVVRAEQADDDFAIGEGRVVVRDFPQASSHGGAGARFKSEF